jgi:CspA family cold shock protein
MTVVERREEGVRRIMTRGTVRWFSDETGEGCIAPDGGGEDLFVCITGVAPFQGGAFEVLQEGAMVVYEPVVGERVLRAENVRRIV